MIQELRKYRIQFENPFLNSMGKGIALIDLIGTFMIGYILNEYFKITDFFKIKQETYYILLIIFGVVSHLFIKQKTFLNNKLFNSNVNVYKIIFICIIFKTLYF